LYYGKCTGKRDFTLQNFPGRSAVLEKLRGAINHSHSIMKHIIGGMDATKEFIFKAFNVF
jgi:hypothetical protein